MTAEFQEMKTAALAFIDSCEEFDQSGQYDSHKIIEIMEAVSVWIRTAEREIGS